MYNTRVKKVIESLKASGIKQGLISSPDSIFYLTGTWVHPGERLIALMVSDEKPSKIIANKLFALPSKIGDIEVVTYDDIENPLTLVYDFIDPKSVVAIDDFLPAKFLIDLMDIDGSVSFQKIGKPLSHVRMIKDSAEIEKMIYASKVNDDVMGVISKELTSGKSELELTSRLLEIYKEKGSSGFSFEPIVCFGVGTSEPHHATDGTTPSENCAVIVDIGGLDNDYCSDMTRSFFIGHPDEEYIKIYNLVLEANLAAIKAAKPGVKLCDIDKAARDVITNAGYGEFFTHRTGHGIGISVHELPDVSSSSEAIATEGMIFSIEPGIYLPGKYGVRIEDLVLVTKEGCKVLNNYPKELKTL